MKNGMILVFGDHSQLVIKKFVNFMDDFEKYFWW